MNIQAAINDLRERIADAEFVDSMLVEEVADDWELHPKLLERKFEEQHGCGVLEWTPPAPVKERDLESLRPLAEAWYNEQFRGSGAEIGSTFKRGDRRGFVVAITTSAVYYIDAQNEKRMKLVFRNAAQRASWVEAQL